MTLETPLVKQNVFPKELACFYAMSKLSEGKAYLDHHEAAQCIPKIKQIKDNEGNLLFKLCRFDFRLMDGGQAYSRALQKVFEFFTMEEIVVDVDEGYHITSEGVSYCGEKVIEYRNKDPEAADKLVEIIRRTLKE